MYPPGRATRGKNVLRVLPAPLARGSGHPEKLAARLPVERHCQHSTVIEELRATSARGFCLSDRAAQAVRPR
jgi:hypothetical protein